MKKSVVIGLALLLVLSVSSHVYAEYPEKALRVIVPFPPGGGSDRLTRMLDRFSKEEFGHNFIFVYKSGAGGAIGFSEISKAKPNGYWIGTINVPQMVLFSLTGMGDFKPDGFEYICQVASDPQVLVSPGNSNLKTLEQFIEAAKQKPGHVTVGSPGGLSICDLATYKLMEEAGIKVTIIPFKGGADMNAALLGGHVDAGMANIGVVTPEKHNLNFLAVTQKERHRFIPDVPTFSELGFNIETAIRRLYVAPKGFDADKLKIVEEKLKEIWGREAYQKNMMKAFFSPVWMSGKEAQAVTQKWYEDAQQLLKKYKK